MGFQVIRGVLTVVVVFAAVLLASFLVMNTSGSSDVVVGVLSKEYVGRTWPGSHWQVQTQLGRFRVDASDYPNIVPGAAYKANTRGASLPAPGVHPLLICTAEVPPPPR